MAQPRLLADLAGEALDLERRRLASASSVASATRSSNSPVGSSGLTVSVGARGRPRRRRVSTSSARSWWRELERLAGVVGVEDELDEPGAVAQVDEDQAAVVAAAVDPAGDAAPREPTRSPSTWPHQVSRYAFGRSGWEVRLACGHRDELLERVRRGRPAAARRSPCRAPRQRRVSSRITARRAPTRSACFIWPLSERPARSSSARSPAPRSSRDERERAALARRRRPATKTSAVGSHRGLVERQQDPLDPGRPAARRRSAARRALDQPVVAPAAADLRDWAPSALGVELEDGARVVVEPADEGRVDLVVDPRPGRAGRAPRRSARRPRSSSRSSIVGALAITACVPSSLESKARSGFSSIRSRTSSASSASCARR